MRSSLCRMNFPTRPTAASRTIVAESRKLKKKNIYTSLFHKHAKNSTKKKVALRYKSKKKSSIYIKASLKESKKIRSIWSYYKQALIHFYHSISFTPVIDALLHVVPTEDAGVLVDHGGQALERLAPHLQRKLMTCSHVKSWVNLLTWPLIGCAI